VATSHISLDTGSTLRTATHTITEDAATKHIPRSVLNDSAGADHGVAANPLYVIPSGGVTTISGVVTVTGSTVIVSMPAITGSTSVVNTVAITGNVTAIGTTIVGTTSTLVLNVQGATGGIPLSVTGSTVIVSMPAITGSTSVVNTVTITGSTTVVGTVTITGSTAIVAALPAGTNNIGDVDVLSMPTVTITGSTTIVGTVTITGSTTLIGTSTITGSTSVVNTVTVTGNTTLVHVGFPNKASSTVNVATPTTDFIVVPSHATLCIYLTDLVVSNGAAAGNITFGETNTTTEGNIKIHPLYFAANGGMVWPLINPIKLSATTNLVAKTLTATTLSVTATYYYAA